MKPTNFDLEGRERIRAERQANRNWIYFAIAAVILFIGIMIIT